VFLLIAALTLVLPGAGVWWGVSLVHDAVARRAAAGNAATARSVAAQANRSYNERTITAENLLVLLANGATLDASLIDVQRLASPFCGIDLLDANGHALRSLPFSTCPARLPTRQQLDRAGDRVRLDPIANPAGASSTGVLLRLNDVEQNRIRPLHRVRWLEVQFTIVGLITPVTVGRSGSFSLVDSSSGVILAGPVASTIGHPIGSPAALRQVRSGRAGVLQTYAPHLHEHVLTAYQPNAGTRLGVFVSLPTTEAFADAIHLRTVLLTGFGVLLALGLTVAATVAALLARRERRLAEKVSDLERMARTDALTGLPNRAAVVAAVDEAVALVNRGQLRGVAVIFVDLDGVKTLNDRCGHAVTDTVLAEIAAMVPQALRTTDTFGRFGGDEFVLVSPGTSTGVEAQQLAQRLCAAIRNVTVLDDQGEPVGVTASAGVALATVDRPPTDTDTLLRRADRAMYAAKRSSRDTPGGVGLVPRPRADTIGRK
jgi:diguanylate cyclase (GGDEF)-like protein